MKTKYTDYNRKKSQEARFKNMLSVERDYPPPRPDGELYLRLNGKETYIYLEPAGNIAQWKSTINGVLFMECAGMHHVYRELAFINPPARNFI